MLEAGNAYEFVETDKGVPTFRHLQTGENLHGQAGPWEEAWNLYVNPAQLETRGGTVVIYDVGMGCAAQVLASLAAFERNGVLKRCDVVSFDLESRGIAALLGAIERFPYARPYEETLRKLLECGEARRDVEGRTFYWRFVPGDFRETIAQTQLLQLPAPDLIFYDFFSPSRHPHLWTSDLFLTLFRASSSEALLYTYSSATAVRAALAAAGFFVGYGVASGKKSKTTVASKRISDLIDPLPVKWANTFFASHIPFVAVETSEGRARIRERVGCHPQFSAAER